MLWPDIKCSLVEVAFYGFIEHVELSKVLRFFDTKYYQFHISDDSELKYEEIDQTLVDQWIENL